MFTAAKLNPTQRVASAIGASVSLPLLVFSFPMGGRYALEGTVLGLLLGIWTISTLAILSHALIRDRLQPSKGVFLTLLVAILKLPITLLLLYVGATLHPPGLGFFLGGLALVYSCTVWFLMGSARE